MLYVLHGTDHVASRAELHRLRSTTEAAEFIRLDGRKLGLADLQQALASGTLFGGTRCIFIEHLLTRFSRANTESAQYIALLASTDHTVVVWEPKKMSNSIKKSLPESADVALFMPSSALFRFLESIAPKNPKTLAQFEQALVQTAPELIAYMLIRQFRLLLALKTSAGSVTLTIAPWQRNRLQRQAAKFSPVQLLDAYRALFVLDSKNKQGQLAVALPTALRHFLLEIR